MRIFYLKKGFAEIIFYNQRNTLCHSKVLFSSHFSTAIVGGESRAFAPAIAVEFLKVMFFY